MNSSDFIVGPFTIARVKFSDIRIATGTNEDQIFVPPSLITIAATISRNAWNTSATTTKPLYCAPMR